MTHEEMEALKKVVDYLWEDEARNYAETEIHITTFFYS